MRSIVAAAAMRCVIRIAVRSRITASSSSRIARSVSASTLESESSRIRIGGSPSTARASVARWRCPPESVKPRSPTTVSSPRGKRSRSPDSCEISSARSSSSSEMCGRPKVTLSRTVREKRNASWGT